ncbi:MAG: hypothetical protein ACOH5I_00130 [Oligoflexus sp.]
MATKALLAELQTAIAEYLETHSNLSIQSVSNKAQVSYSTVRRILQNEANDVRDETILSLIQVIMSRPRRIDFLNKFYPALGALIHQDEVEDSELDQEKLRLFRYKDPHNYVLKMALTAHGTNRTTIRRILGERGVNALEEMVEEGFLTEESSGMVYHSSRGSVIMNADDILYQVKKDADYFDKDLVGSPFARLAHLSASLNQEAYLQLMELVSEFIKKSERLKEDPKSRGRTPIFIDLMINTYDKDSLEGVS